MHIQTEKNCTGPVLVIGNGPSTKLLDFEANWINSITTVGMNAAYRFWEKTGFRPTFYICMDDVVVKNIAHDILRLVKEGRIKQFFLKDSIKEICPEASNFENIIWHSEMERNHSIFQNCPISTGGWAIRWMVSKNYGYICTIGIDGINTELLSESEKDETSGQLGLKISETPKFNPNYFFSDYQVKGDKYQVPNNPGYEKAKGRPFHEDALLYIKRYLEDNLLKTRVIDLSPLSNHGIFPKGDVHYFRKKTSFSVALNLQTLEEGSLNKLISIIDNNRLAENIYLLKQNDRRAIEGIETQYVSMHTIDHNATLEIVAQHTDAKSLPENLIILREKPKNLEHVLKKTQQLFASHNKASVAYVKSDTQGSQTVLGIALNLREASRQAGTLKISHMFDKFSPAFSRILKNNLFSIEQPKDAFRIEETPFPNHTQEGVWPWLCQLSAEFPQLAISESTPHQFSPQQIWIGSCNEIHLELSAAKLLSYCIPESKGLKNFFESLTIRVNGPEFTLDYPTICKIKDSIDAGCMIEWEISGFDKPIPFKNFLEILKNKTGSRLNLLQYPIQSFVNTDSATPEQRVAHSDVMLLIKYLMGEGKSCTEQLPSKKATQIKIDCDLDLNGRPQTPFEPFEVKGKSNNPYHIVKCDFGISRVTFIAFQLELISQHKDVLTIRVCRNGPTEFESKNFRVPVNPGNNSISLPVSFSHIHNGCRLEILESKIGENKVSLKNIYARGEEVIKNAINGTLTNYPVPREKKIEIVKNSEYLAESNSVVAIIDPDGIDLRGHYLAYDKKLSESLNNKGIKTKILSRIDIKANDSLLESSSLIKCFKKNSWTIANNMDVFKNEIEKGVGELKETINKDAKIILYFYTGSVHHLSVLCDYASQNKNIYIHINLFWEMIRDIRTPEYSKLIEKTINRASKSQGRIIVSSPTYGVRNIVEEISGVSLPVAPHPSTAVTDTEFIEHLSRTNHLKRRPKANNADKQLKRVIFPGASTINKGYEIGLKSALKLTELGYECWVREEPDYDNYENLNLIPRHLSDESFKSFFAESDVAVLPYQPEGFANRTSGLVIDALYLGVPVVVIKGTWLSEVVTTYKTGECVNSNPECIVSAVERITSSPDYSRESLVNRASEYYEKNSWAKLANFIIERFEFEIFDYRFANQLFRNGNYMSALRIYNELKLKSGFSIYDRNIDLCNRKLEKIKQSRRTK